MRYTDVAIVGGGLAGSTAAAMLGRAGIAAVLIDPHPVYPPELRCEKLGGEQLDLLRKTGLAEATLRATTLDGEVWEARFGYLVAKRPSDQHGIMYDTLVNTMRAQIPPDVETIHAKAISISNSGERQKLVLSNGEEISARLIVLANGLNIGLRHHARHQAPGHQRMPFEHLGFDVEPVGRAAFDFPALTYWPERTSDRMAYLTLFPVGNAMRANLMVYRDMTDPWLRQFRAGAGSRPCCAMMPALAPHGRRIQGQRADQDPAGRPVRDRGPSPARHRAGRRRLLDLLPRRRHRHRQGVHRRRAAVQRLHSGMARHATAWAREKIEAFYDDPVKTACDAWSTAKAYHLRSLTLDNGLKWRAQRWARFLVRLGQGIARRMRGKAVAGPDAAKISRRRTKPSTALSAPGGLNGAVRLSTPHTVRPGRPYSITTASWLIRQATSSSSASSW